MKRHRLTILPVFLIFFTGWTTAVAENWCTAAKAFRTAAGDTLFIHLYWSPSRDGTCSAAEAPDHYYCTNDGDSVGYSLWFKKPLATWTPNDGAELDNLIGRPHNFLMDDKFRCHEFDSCSKLLN